MFLTLGKSYLSLFEKAILTFVSFPTMRQCNVSSRNFLCWFPYFVIELKAARLTPLSAIEFSSTRKFLMLGILTFTIFFFYENIFSGYIFWKEFYLFSKMVQATNCPFSVSPSSVTRKMVSRNPALIDLRGKSASNVSEPSPLQ